jgi:2-keto-3-deoxy-L-rhamnonate aldolase RhmA
MNAFAQLLQSSPGHPPLGTWVMSASPLVAEAVGHAGFRWGVLDMEHTPLDGMEVLHLLQAVAGTAMLPVVRVPWNDAVVVKRVLDLGATTVLFPFVQNAEEARRAVAATRYPPAGVRGMAGMSRASRFGTTAGYLQHANEGVAVIVQLETPQAIDALESIATVEGVDALFIGPADLSASIGHVGQLTHPAVLDLMGRAVQRAHATGRPIGTVGGTPEVVIRYREMGFDFVGIASDLGLMMRAASAVVATLQPGAAVAPTSQGY